ncbi:MAG: hypothetical protein NWE89_02290 [Candidatus Bathyarchaeota archaeon]|nr:hypothetical protein [Candidatus Bathyarchaeota archaeon]
MTIRLNKDILTSFSFSHNVNEEKGCDTLSLFYNLFKSGMKMTGSHDFRISAEMTSYKVRAVVG